MRYCPKKLASLGFGRRATPAQKTQVVQKLRQRHSLDILLSIAQLPRATFYYYLKRMNSGDKYEAAKAEIIAIYHENKGRYGYRRIDTQLTLAALNMAVRRKRPEPGLIFHSDRGVQYAAAAFRDRLSALGIRLSMSRKGVPYDNAVAENFFSCLKCELVHLQTL